MPSYPSLTFPNHFTIVTGLYPEHHGLVANSFYDETKQARYAINDAKAVTDGSWYSGGAAVEPGGEPGNAHGVLFLAGFGGRDRRAIAHVVSHFRQQDSATDEWSRRASTDAVALLQLPAAERPHFITIYYSEPDHEGHEFGPDAPETKAAVLKMDALVGKLKAALDATGLPIDLVVVSDHGMAKEQGGWITLDQFADLSGFETDGPLLYGKTEEDRARVYNQLKKASSQFVVFRRKNVPAGLNYNQNPREGDPVVIATGPLCDSRAHAARRDRPDDPPIAGMHGFDPRKMPEMKASFFAAGPDIVHGQTVLPFENVNLYPWLAHMLGLRRRRPTAA